MVEIKVGDLFSAPPKSILLHACNSLGVWGGRGSVATQFASRFPLSYSKYNKFCTLQNNKLGHWIVNEEKDYIICSLIVSSGIGRNVDSPSQILENTEKSLMSLLNCLHNCHIHSPKINSGLFHVPWEDTLKVIDKCLMTYHNKGIKWTVWDLQR